MPSLVIHIVLSLDCGGLERLVVDWTRERNRRFPGSTRIMCLDRAGQLACELPEEAVIDLHANRSRFPWDLGAVRRIRDEIRDLCRKQSGPVIVHSHNPAAQFYAALAIQGTTGCHVHTRHGPEIFPTGWRGGIRGWMARLRTHRWVAVSEATAERMRRQEGLARQTIQIIQNGIPPWPGNSLTAEDRLRIRMEKGLDPDGVWMGCVGRLDKVKGQDRLVRIFPELLKTEPTLHLLFVGDGPFRETVEGEIHRWGLSGRVKLAGFQTDIYEWLLVLDFFALPSRAEGLSLSILEAMQAGVPVMVTDVGANRMILEEGKWGELLSDDETNWPRQIASRLEQWKAGALKAQVEGARARVETHFSMERTMAEYERVYQERVAK